MKNKGKRFFTKRVLQLLFVVCAGILFYALLSHLPAIGGWVGWVYGIISPFVIAVAIAYLLDIPVRFFARTLFAKLRRGRILSIVVTYLLAFFLVGLLVGLIIPQLIASVRSLLDWLSGYLGNLQSLADELTQRLNLADGSLDFIVVSYEEVVSKLRDWFLGAVPDIIDWTVKLGSGVVSALTAIIASIYMLASKGKLLAQIRRVLYAAVPKRGADEVYRIADISNRVFAGFVSGKVIDSVVVGIVNWLFMTIVNALFLPMPYALLISVLVGVTNIIPFFGPFIGAIPSVLILLMVNPWSALVFIIFTLILQQVEGNIIQPKILGDTTGLPALWVLVAIIVGGGINGVWGMIWGVPVAAVLYTLFSDVVAKSLQKRKLDEHGQPLEDEPEEDASVADEPPSGGEGQQET